MKRTIPLWITAACGFVLIAAHFSPYTESWGEVTMIWFDILASIAFLLGGGNLLKTHLKKISDHAAGWAYSAITVLAFLVTLYVGLVKWGAPPAQNQECFGQAFTPLALADFPATYALEGTIPERAAGGRLPASAAWQLGQQDGRVTFHGWMLADQRKDLLAYKDQLRWQCTVERLAEAAQPPKPLRGKVTYLVDHQVLAFAGHMTRADQDALLALGDSAEWRRAVQTLHDRTQAVTEVSVTYVPPGFDAEKAKAVGDAVRFDPQQRVLGIQGPMSRGQREALSRQFPPAPPLPKDSPAREALLGDLAGRGPLNDEQIEALHALLDAGWTIQELVKVVNIAGLAEEVPKTACEMLREQEQGVTNIQPKKPKGQDHRLSDQQVAVLRESVSSGDLTVDGLLERLARDPDTLTDKEKAAVKGFFEAVPSRAERNKDLCLALLKAGPLTREQSDWLLAGYRDQLEWQRAVHRLFDEAHVVKFAWSGEYNAPGTPFWWLYEYAFKPLTATMFALLAFYVASAAFRAFRAKNVEATLLLATAFIILLGRTFAGAVATAWLPDWLSGLRIDNLTVTIMTVFNTAGTRAIMIGIALGIASTSLRVLLGIDRSYLGSGEG